MNDELVTSWELDALARKGVLEGNEVVCDMEEAWKRTGWGRGCLGALIVTDRRVLFSSTRAFRKRTRLDAAELGCVREVEVVPSKWGERRGAIRIGIVERERIKTLLFERLPGGPSRAQELVKTVERQRMLLERSSPASD